TLVLQHAERAEVAVAGVEEIESAGNRQESGGAADAVAAGGVGGAADVGAADAAGAAWSEHTHHAGAVAMAEVDAKLLQRLAADVDHPDLAHHLGVDRHRG